MGNVYKACCLAVAGEYAQAHRLLERVIPREANRSDAYILQGRILVETGKLEEAIKSFNKVLTRQPKSH